MYQFLRDAVANGGRFFRGVVVEDRSCFRCLSNDNFGFLLTVACVKSGRDNECAICVW